MKDKISEKNNKHEEYKNLLILVSLLLFIGLLVLYLYIQSSFQKINYEEKTILEYLLEGKDTKLVINENWTINIEIPENVLNTEIMKRLDNKKIKNISFDIDVGEIIINSRRFGLSVSTVIDVKYEIENGKIYIALGEKKFGKGRTTLTDNIEGYIIKNLDINEEVLVISKEKLNLPDYIQIKEIRKNNENNIILEFYLDREMIEKEIGDNFSALNKELLGMYKKSKQTEIFNYLEDEKNYLEAVRLIANDYFNSGNLIKDIISLTNDENINEFINKYGKYFNEEIKDEIFDKKEEYIKEFIKNSYGIIVENIEKYYQNIAQENIYINKGKLYSVNKSKYISIEEINDYYGMELSKEALGKTDIIYDTEGEIILLTYKIDNDRYFIGHDKDLIIISSSEYSNRFYHKKHGETKYVNDIKTLEDMLIPIKKYFEQEKIFVRYIKTDDKYATAIISPEDAYQSYWVMALIKENNKWEILESNITSIKKLNDKHRSFNLETITKEIETVKTYNLSEKTKELLIEELISKKFISKNEEIKIVYCSFDGNYISAKLSNEEEYIFRVYRMYIEKVLPRNKALEMYNDIPEILILQNIENF